MNLRFDNVSYAFKHEVALAAIDLTAKSGEILCLLGQSGSGKTTLLNLTAGILPIQKGEIYLDGRLLASKALSPPPEKRPVGLVFQEGALFPHMTVAENIGFGISAQNAKQQAVTELLEQIGLEGFGARYPDTLSGGQQQRVALARALAPKPAVLLMDEPFANIDIMLRRRLREETRRILKARDCITILITHDPEEAAELSDSIAVMDKGMIAQHGSADDLYHNPVSLTAAMLTGAGTVLPGEIAGNDVNTAFGNVPISWFKKTDFSYSNRAVKILIRPDQVWLKQDKAGCRIVDVRRTGYNQLVTLQSAFGDFLTLNVTLKSDENWSQGDIVSLHAAPSSLLLFES